MGSLGLPELLVILFIVILIFGAVNANASTYVWFLLFSAAFWTSRRARRESLLRTSALEESLRIERAERS